MRKKAVPRRKPAKKPAKKAMRKKAVAKKRAAKKTMKKKTVAKRPKGRKSAAKKATRKSVRKARPRAKGVTYMVPPFRSVTPHIVVRDVPAAIDFYKRAFDAVERFRVPTSDGQHIMHAEIMIGDSVVMMAEEMPGSPGKSPSTLGGSPVFIHLYVPNTDATYTQAVAAGATATMSPQDMFWGDRFSQVTDPFGHKWSIATHVREPSATEFAAGAAALERPA